MKPMNKQAMIKRLSKANRDIEAVHLSSKVAYPMMHGQTLEQLLTKLTLIRADIGFAISWLEEGPGSL